MKLASSTILGLGRLLNERSMKITFADLKNFVSVAFRSPEVPLLSAGNREHGNQGSILLFQGIPFQGKVRTGSRTAVDVSVRSLRVLAIRSARTDPASRPGNSWSEKRNAV